MLHLLAHLCVANQPDHAAQQALVLGEVDLAAVEVPVYVRETPVPRARIKYRVAQSLGKEVFVIIPFLFSFCCLSLLMWKDFRTAYISWMAWADLQILSQ